MKLNRIRHLLLAKVALLALWGCVSGCSPAANSNFIVPTVPATVQNNPPSILQSGGSSPSESRVVTQADSHLHVLPFGGWACDFGYHQDGSRCVSVIVPENAQLSYFGNSWECMNGFQRDGSRCISVAVPEHGHLAYFGHSWECDSGFQQDGTLCAQVSVPVHGHLNYFGHSWECDSGFQQEGNSCAVVAVPEHGHLAYFGHSWECDSGFLINSNSCVPAPSSASSPNPPSYGNYAPICAENGSCYGDISNITGLPKTVPVNGYFRSDGTYVRGYYRSR
jgi:hypothetical protein